ncbi:SDR family oxidoreductase [Celeribacter indicus]|uniref:Oxidoreductase, short-chain dehydrogenase/reductase n=1 Tax=Celeribacter indicus TaxID=1208324 RepID=A0A0B5E868_9RHOB|nr:SDR family oxidoreductase [Celeribacter indicus]AJE49211.1 oxidoreductase, short-chain dehydrogenase/reductase [Celeribacter indicus]SDX51699.1 NAD(P)-dependent dehydrogenase, short-chain alcohol dehydrogenase family [Celeribacter indicus]
MADTAPENPRSPFETFARDMLRGRTAFVTGGGTGIGFGIARTLGLLGAKVAIVSRKEEVLNSARTALDSEGIETLAVPTDIRDFAAVEAAVAQTVARLGSLDILVNCAAGLFHTPAEELTENGWKVLIDINLNGAWACCKAAFEPLSKAEQGGRIVNIVSPFAWQSWPGSVNAAAAKAGLISMAHTLAVEWGRYNIHVNNVAPGPIGGTGGINRMADDPERFSAEIERTSLGRLGQIGDIAEAVAYLASPAGSFISGADLLVDGGRQHNMVPSKVRNLRAL